MTAVCKKNMTYILFPSFSADNFPVLFFGYLERRQLLLTEPMSKFHTVVSGSIGNVVVGDHAVLHIGTASRDGKKMKFLTLKSLFNTMVEHFTSGFLNASVRVPKRVLKSRPPLVFSCQSRYPSLFYVQIPIPP